MSKHNKHLTLQISNSWSSIPDEETYDTVVNCKSINSNVTNSNLNVFENDNISMEGKTFSNCETTNSSMHLNNLFKEDDIESSNDLVTIQAKDSHTLLRRQQQDKVSNINVSTETPCKAQLNEKNYERFEDTADQINNGDNSNIEEVLENSVKLYLLKRTRHDTGAQQKPIIIVPLNKKDSNKKQEKKNDTYAPLKQRIMELHKYKISVQQRRLDLLDLKIQREREALKREKVLFERDFQDASSSDTV